MSITRLPLDLVGGVSTRRRRTVWIAVLTLSPLAYFGAAALENRLPHRTGATTIERQHAIAIARDFARTQQVDTADWVVSTSAEEHESVADWLNQPHPAAADLVAAPYTAQVRFAKDTRWVIVHLTPAGRVVGFSVNTPQRGNRPVVPEDRARQISLDYLRAQLGAGFDLRPATAAQIDKTGWQRQVAWDAQVGPAATARFHVTVTGERVTADSRTLVTPNAKTNRWPVGRIVYVCILAIFYVGFAIYGIVRYVRRSIEKEISHRRTLLVAFGFLLAGAALVTFTNSVNIKTDADLSGGARAVIVWASVMLTFFVMGLFFGVAYGAGEGDLREAYPGKLVSLDALLAGKVFSANFAKSALAGVAAAGWFLLVQNALLLLFHAGPLGGGTDSVIVEKLRYPLLTVFGEKFGDIAMLTGYGLLLPLTLLRPRLRNPWLFYPALAILCALGARGSVPDSSQWQVKAGLQFVAAAVVCLPFLFGDLAAAVSSVAAWIVVGDLLRRSVTSSDWREAAYSQILPLAILFLIVEIYCSWRGRVYEEAEVRPLYARHLVERQTLAAEIGAARTAQLRLLPDTPPQIAGLTIAGSCTPAREVGGDFFDYYALDDHRLGVFVAEGGDRELGSAMAIALAKGFLMYSARLDLPPVENLRGLRETLATVLHGENASMSVLYAVVDGHTGAVRYARAGTSPRLLLNGSPLAEEVTPGDEIRHGAAHLAPQDALVFFTDGLSRQTVERARKTPEQLLCDLRQRFADATAADLHRALMDVVFRKRPEAPPDDLTAVIICRASRAAEALEEIA